jgi:hypothetical protein
MKVCLSHIICIFIIINPILNEFVLKLPTKNFPDNIDPEDIIKHILGIDSYSKLKLSFSHIRLELSDKIFIEKLDYTCTEDYKSTVAARGTTIAVQNSTKTYTFTVTTKYCEKGYIPLGKPWYQLQFCCREKREEIFIQIPHIFFRKNLGKKYEKEIKFYVDNLLWEGGANTNPPWIINNFYNTTAIKCQRSSCPELIIENCVERTRDVRNAQGTIRSIYYDLFMGDKCDVVLHYFPRLCCVGKQNVG